MNQTFTGTGRGGWWDPPHLGLLRHRWAGVLLFALLGFAGSAAVSLATGIPQPEVHDEFSYLLAGDTFASGRLANPTHPHWQHFETFHVLQRPTYVSKYPPGQGIILALGQVLFGHPVAGVWLSIGFLCGAMYWMLSQWVPVKWSALGAFLVLVQIGLISYWAQSYWGGAVAATGGALLFGGGRRLVDRPELGAGIATGLGLGILALTRPLEGLLASLPVLVVVGLILFRRSTSGRRALLTRGVLPALGLGILAVGFFGYYNWRTTGSPVRPGYVEYNRQYGTTSLLGWQDRERPTYRHPRIEQFYDTYVSGAVERVRHGFLRTLPLKLLGLAFFFLGPAVIALVMLPWVLKERWLLFAFTTTLLVLGFVLTTNRAYPHYLAPVTALVFLLVVASLRELREFLSNSRLGTAIIISILLVVSIRIVWEIQRPETLFARERQRIVNRLQAHPGRDLVLVAYEEGHEERFDIHDEFVYNRANIDQAPIVWARYMGAREATELVRYFSERRAWLLRVGRSTTRLVPFSAYREEDVSGRSLLDPLANLLDPVADKTRKERTPALPRHGHPLSGLRGLAGRRTPS